MEMRTLKVGTLVQESFKEGFKREERISKISFLRSGSLEQF